MRTNDTNIEAISAATEVIVKKGMHIELRKKVDEYLRTRMGDFGQCQDAEIYKSGYGVKIAYQPLRPVALGMLKFMLTECHVEVEYLFFEKDSNGFEVRVSFNYVHPDGGRNGHEVGFKIVGDIRDGSFTEIDMTR